MSRNNLIFVIVTVIILGVLGVGAYLYFFTDFFKGGSAPSGQNNSFLGFLPFGNTGGGNNNATSGGAQNQNQQTGQGAQNGGSQEISRLFKLVQNPVSGFTSFPQASTTIVRYMEKETGHVMDIDMSMPAARTKISITTIPRIYETIFGSNGSSAILRYLDDDNVIQTYSANIPRATSSAQMQSGVEIKGKFLQGNIRTVSLSPSKTKIFYLLNFGNSYLGTVSDLDGGLKSQIFDSPFTEWLSSWVNDKTILLSTKPSSSAQGYVYSLDAKSGSFRKIYGGTNGLTAIMSPDEKNLLISESSNNTVSLKIYNTANRGVNDTGLKTITDKCVFSSNNTVYCAVPGNMPFTDNGYPDSWYQGLVLFSDSIWRIDMNTLSTNVVSNLRADSREDIDAINLALNKNGDYLFFMNKRDNSLWSLKLIN